MGLDMYLTGNKFFPTLYDVQHDPLPRETEDGFPIEARNLKLGYWRKHPNLHGYIVNTFADGLDECREIELSAERIQTILQAINDDDLPFTDGFFFGASDGSEKPKDIEIFTKALEWLQQKDGVSWRSVIYCASW